MTTPSEDQTRAKKASSCLRQNSLTLLTVGGVLAGTALGIVLRSVKDDWTPREVIYVRFIGDLFLRMLKSLVLPLIVSTLVSSIGLLDLSLSRKMGLRAITYYTVTTGSAILLGILLVSVIQPGTNSQSDVVLENQQPRNVTTQDTLMDLVRNMVPPNIVEAALKQCQTTLVYPGNDAIPIEEWKMILENHDGTNILGLVMFATVLGICLAKMDLKAKPLLDFFTCLSEAMMILTHWVIWLSPVGVCFLITGQLIEQKDLGKVFQNLGYYFGTVLIGLFIHGAVVLPLIFVIATRTLPFRFILNTTQAVVTAFGTASSTASLSVTLQCLEENNRVNPKVARFLLPIGATINMDGTALYEAVAAIYIAQLVGTPLDIGKLFAISIASTAASIGAAGIPQAGLVTMVMVLNTIGLPAEYVAYIVPVDWLLDRFRTAVNILGDALGVGIVEKLSGKELQALNVRHVQGAFEEINLNDLNHSSRTVD